MFIIPPYFQRLNKEETVRGNAVGESFQVYEIGRIGGSKMTKKKMVHDFWELKQKGEKITFLTAYDYPTARFIEEACLDMILVGDSLGMCVYGYPGTLPVTMNQMIAHAEAVRRGGPNTFIVGDMPFMVYQSSVEKAVENAGRF